MKIVFVSFIDSTNLGDLLIAEILEKRLMSEHEVTKFSFNFLPERFISKQDRRIKNTINNSKLKSLYNEYFRKNYIIDKIHSFRIARNIDNNKYLPEFEEAIKKCDLVVVGGGNAIFDLTPQSISAYKFYKILGFAKKYNKKTFVTSVGIGPFQTNKQLKYTIEVLEKADFITVRDQKSFDYLKSSLGEKVHLSIDPVFLLDKLTISKKNESKMKVISICVIDLTQNKDNKEKYTKFIDGLALLIRHLNKENYKINLYSTEPRDYGAVYNVYENIDNQSNVSVIDIKSFNDLIDLYSKTDLIIGTRMHSMIIALSQFIPVIGLSWQDKVNEMFEMINSPGDVFEIDEIKSNIDKIKKIVSQKISDFEHLNKELKNTKNKNEEKFIVNHKLINKLIEEIKEYKGTKKIE